MKPHKPISLEELDAEFFSQQKKKSTPEVMTRGNIFTGDAQDGEDISVLNNEPPLHPSLTPDVIEGLMNLSTAQSSSVFHDLPEDNTPDEAPKAEEQSENIPIRKKTPLISEEEALKSFPNFDFDPTAFEPPEEENVLYPAEEKPLSRKELKKAAKEELKEEKAKLKAQKNLEHTVQKPFKAKRILVLMMILFTLIGVIISGLFAVLYLSGNTPETALKLGEYSLFHIDASAVKSSETDDLFVLCDKTAPAGNKMIIFNIGSETRAETVLTINGGASGGYCVVAYSGEPIAIMTDSVIATVRLAVPHLGNAYSLAHSNSTDILCGIAVYFAVIFIFFGAMLHIKNKKIKKYRESYQLVK